MFAGDNQYKTINGSLGIRNIKVERNKIPKKRCHSYF